MGRGLWFWRSHKPHLFWRLLAALYCSVHFTIQNGRRKWGTETHMSGDPRGCHHVCGHFGGGNDPKLFLQNRDSDFPSDSQELPLPRCRSSLRCLGVYVWGNGPSSLF